MIVFSETVECGMYDKLNLYGVNFSEVLYVDKYPYRLTGHAIIQTQCEAGGVLEVYVIDSINQEPVLVAKEINETDSDMYMRIYPFEVLILTECSITIECRSKKYTENKVYRIKQGNAPSKIIRGLFPEKGIVNNSIAYILKAIISRATTEILIHDTYFDIDQLANLFSDAMTGVKVKVITGPNYFKTINKDKSFMEIKSSTRGHDRFICLDNDEVYVFGYSFKELINKPKRLSYFTKIYNKEDIEGFNTMFYAIWNNPEKRN